VKKLAKPPAKPLAEAPDVRSFALGREKVQSNAWGAGMARIGERFARRLRGLIDPMIDAKSQVVVGEVETKRWDVWRANLPAFTSLSLYRLRPMKGGMMIHIDPDFISALLDTVYGGPGAAWKRPTSEFTPAEEKLLGRLRDGMVAGLGEAWSEVAPLQPAAVGHETNPDFANAFRNDEQVLIQHFTLGAGDIPPTDIAIAYSLGAMRAVEAQLTAKVHDDAGPADELWRLRMASALQEVRLPVRSVLARPELSVSQLMALKPGDVIPITIPAAIPLLVANKRVASGTIGEKNGLAAIQVTSVERDPQ
jgi:flagellar motor switch protein FliM